MSRQTCGVWRWLAAAVIVLLCAGVETGRDAQVADDIELVADQDR